MKPSKQRISATTTSLYDQDFFVWTERTAQMLRAGRFQDIDAEHAAEEIEGIGKRDLKELNSRVQVLLMHLLKWLLQADKRSPSWQATIVTQRIEIEAILDQSPSLHARLERELPANYLRAIKRAVPETGLSKQRFPAECPFTLAQILDDDFLPG